MQTSTPVKFAFGDDLRRVTLGTDVSLAEVQRAVRDRFGLRNVVGLTYEDDEGDVVTVGTDEELQEAFRLFRVLERCPRFVISETDTVFEEPETTEPETVVCETTKPDCVTQPVEPVVVGTPTAPAEAEIEVALPDSTEVQAVIGDTSAQQEEIIEPDVIAVDIQRCPRKVLNGMWDRMASDANGHPVFQKQQESDQFFLYVRPTGRWVIDNHLLPEGTGPVFWHSLTGDLEGPWAKFPTWETLDTVRAMPIVHPDAPRMGVEDGDHDMQVVLDRDDRDFASGVYHRRENKNGHAHWTKRARCQKCGFSPAHFEQLAACPCGSTETVAPRELFFEPRRSWVIAPTTDLDEGAFYILKDGLQALGQPTQRWLGAVVRGSAEAPVFAFVRKPHRDGELSEEALQLLAMGYELHAVLKALQKHGNRVDLALDALA